MNNHFTKDKLRPQAWFEMPDIRRHFFDKSVWIPLRESRTITEKGESGHNGFEEEFFGVGSIAVPISQRAESEKLKWHDIGLSHSGRGYMDNGKYIPANVYKNGELLTAEHLVLERAGNSLEYPEWLLSQDLVIALELKREGDSWVSLSRGYEEVVRLERDNEACPTGMLINSIYLKDYLKSRKMALYITSYRSRVQITDGGDHINWQNNPETDENKTDRWEGRIIEIHEGGHPFGSGVAVFHMGRKDVDFDEDVPEFGPETDENTTSDSWSRNFEGQKLYRIWGELWRNEWVEPATISQIVDEEKAEPTVFFITDSTGKTENRETLKNSSRWLWFKPGIINGLLTYRGSAMTWYTRDTGGVQCSPGNTIHFGVNQIGLINVYAEDIALLPDWQQKIWAGYNVPPNGKVSPELLMSQMAAKPASTIAPEKYLERAIVDLNNIFMQKYGIIVFKQISSADELLKKIHRFRATDGDGLLELAKDLYRSLYERIDVNAIKTIVTDGKKNWGQLKYLEKLIAQEVDEILAYNLVTPLWGLYELRIADSHLPSPDLSASYQKCRIDENSPPIIQGYQLLHSCLLVMAAILRVLHPESVGLIKKGNVVSR